MHSHFLKVWKTPITWRDLRKMTIHEGGQMFEVTVVPWWFRVLVLSKASSVTSTAAPLSNDALHSILSGWRRVGGGGGCALPTNSLMFNSFPDTWGTCITTTRRKKKQKERKREGEEGQKWEGTKCLLFCLPSVDVKLMKGLQQGQT